MWIKPDRNNKGVVRGAVKNQAYTFRGAGAAAELSSYHTEYYLPWSCRWIGDTVGICTTAGNAAVMWINMGRRYKLFNFSLLRGNYQVINGQIIFRDYVEWEIRSPDIYMMRLLESVFWKNGIHYGNQRFSDVALRLMNETVEKDSIHIRCCRRYVCIRQIRRQRRRISTVRRRRLSRNRSMTILSENILPVMVFHRIRE